MQVIFNDSYYALNQGRILFYLLGLNAVFNIISVISQQQFTYSWFKDWLLFFVRSCSMNARPPFCKSMKRASASWEICKIAAELSYCMNARKISQRSCSMNARPPFCKSMKRASASWEICKIAAERSYCMNARKISHSLYMYVFTFFTVPTFEASKIQKLFKKWKKTFSGSLNILLFSKLHRFAKSRPSVHTAWMRKKKESILKNTKKLQLFIVSLLLVVILSFQNMYVLFMYKMWI